MFRGVARNLTRRVVRSLGTQKRTHSLCDRSSSRATRKKGAKSSRAAPQRTLKDLENSLESDWPEWVDSGFEQVPALVVIVFIR